MNRFTLSFLGLMVIAGAVSAQEIKHPYPSIRLIPSQSATAPTHSALQIGNSGEWMMWRPTRVTSAASACQGLFANSSLQCGFANNAFMGQSPTNAQLMYMRDPWLTANRVSDFSGPMNQVTTAKITPITAGTLTFSTAYATYNVTGCNLSTVAAITGTTDTSLSNLLQKCIAASDVASPTGTITGGTLTQKTCKPIGYTIQGAAYFVVTNIGTCPKIYLGATINGSNVTQQLVGSDGLACPSANCNGQTGVYNVFLATSTPANAWWKPENLATMTYSVLNYTTFPGSLKIQGWLSDGCVNLPTCATTNISGNPNPVAVTDTAVGTDTSGCSVTCYITTYTGASISTPQSMTVAAPYMNVSMRYAGGVTRLRFDTDGNFNPGTPTPNFITLLTSGGDGLATAINMTLETGAYASSPGVYATLDTNCQFFNSLLSSIATDLTQVFPSTIGSMQMPGFNGQPGQNAVMAACAAQYGARLQWQPWFGDTNQPLWPASSPMFGLLIASGNNGSTLPNVNTPAYIGLVGGYGNNTSASFTAKASQLGGNEVLWNVSTSWPTAPGIGGFAYGLDTVLETPNDIVSPVETMPTTLYTGSSGYPKALLQDWGPGPSLAVGPNDLVAVEAAPFNTQQETVTASTSAAGTVTLTWATPLSAAPTVGGTIDVFNDPVAGANQTAAPITASTTTSVSYTNAANCTSDACAGGTIQLLSPNAPPSGSPLQLSAIVQSTNCSCFPLTGFTASALNTSGTTQYLVISSNSAPQSAEGTAYIIVPTAAYTVVAMEVSLSVTPATGSYTMTLRHGTANAAMADTAWTGSIAAGSTNLTLCSIAITGCTTPTMTGLPLAQFDTLDISSTGTITGTAPTATISLLIQSSDGKSSWIVGRASSLPSSTSARYYTPAGTGAFQTTEVPFQMFPSLAGFAPTHPSNFTVSISNLTVDYTSTSTHTGRTFNFDDSACNATNAGLTTCTGWAAPAAATTAANCSLVNTQKINNSTTNQWTCANATDTWTPSSFDLFDLVTAGGSATPGATPNLTWSATVQVQ